MAVQVAPEVASPRVLPLLTGSRWVGRPLFLVGLLHVALSLAVHADTATTHCPETTIGVVGGDQVERAEVCAAVAQAWPVLARNGIAIDAPLTIRLVAVMPDVVNEHAFGFFDARSNEITVLDFDAAAASPGSSCLALGSTMTRSLWHSYVAHELAHAAAASRFAPGVPTFTASEYIAAVVQLSVLPERTRQDVLARFGGLKAFGAKSEITSTYYFIDPCAFAVKSYLHYLQPENGPSFIAALLREGN